jgi:hypothetical protein
MLVFCDGTHQQHSTCPLELVVQLPAKLSPTLVEDGPVESGFLPDVATGLFDSAGGRPRHIAHLEVLDEYDRVVFADRCPALCRKSSLVLAMRVWMCRTRV